MSPMLTFDIVIDWVWSVIVCSNGAEDDALDWINRAISDVTWVSCPEPHRRPVPCGCPGKSGAGTHYFFALKRVRDLYDYAAVSRVTRES